MASEAPTEADQAQAARTKDAAGRDATGRRTDRKRSVAATANRATGTSRKRRLERTLRSRSSLQDAIILREVLGPPVSLRPPDEHAGGTR